MVEVKTEGARHNARMRGGYKGSRSEPGAAPMTVTAFALCLAMALLADSASTGALLALAAIAAGAAAIAAMTGRRTSNGKKKSRPGTRNTEAARPAKRLTTTPSL